MIKAKDIIEAYYASFHGHKDYVEVFVNPDQKELRSLGEFIRFIADAETHYIYTWNAEIATHHDVYDEFKQHFSGKGITLDIDGDDMPLRSCLLEGVARGKGNYYRLFEAHGLDGIHNSDHKQSDVIEFLQSVLGYNWSWADRYISITPYLKNFRFSLDYLNKRREWGYKD